MAVIVPEVPISDARYRTSDMELRPYVLKGR